MDNTERIHKNTKLAAVRLGHESVSEDAAQDAVLKYLETGRETTGRNAAVDFLRKNYGRKGERVPNEAEPPATQPVELPENINRIPSIQRATLILKEKYGFTQREIADLFGVTEGAVSLRLKFYKEHRERYFREVSKIGLKIKAYRLKHGLSLRAMGKRVGINYVQLNDYELGKSSPNDITLSKLKRWI